MSLKIYEDIEQRSPEWFEARAGIVTASAIGQLITAKTLKPANSETARSLIRTLAAERITGHVEETPTSNDMWRGILDEPYARDIYSEHFQKADECGFMVRELPGFKIGYSPDGVIEESGLIEIKSRKQKHHLKTILEDAVPPEHMAQIQCGLLTSGREYLDYISYCGGLPLYVKTVHPDPAWQEALTIVASGAEAMIQELITAYEKRIKGMPPTERIDHNELMEITI